MPERNSARISFASWNRRCIHGESACASAEGAREKSLHACFTWPKISVSPVRRLSRPQAKRSRKA